MKKTKALVLTLMMSTFLCACGEKRDDNSFSLNSENTLQYQSNELSETIPVLDEIEFQPDYEEGEQNTAMLSSYIASQGKWIYYYTSDEILKMDENKDVYTVSSVRDVRSICVLGDWIYYSTYNEMGRIKTDGTNQEIIKEIKVMSPFLVEGNRLFYFEERNVSATAVDYSFQCYDMNSKEDIMPENSTCGRILGLYKDRLYLRIEDDGGDEIFVLYIYTDTLDVGEGDDEDTILMIDGLEGGFIYEDQLLYSRSSGWADSLTELYVVNLENGTLDYSTQIEFGKDSSQVLSTGQKTELCGVCNISGEEYWVVWVDYSAIYLIPTEKAKQTLPNSLSVKKIVEENKEEISIYDACVVGNYIYYLGSKNAVSHLYRIGLDGTDWMQLY